MVLNFNLARASYRSERELGEFRKAKSGIRPTSSRDLTRVFVGFDFRMNVLTKRQGWRQVQGPVVVKGLGCGTRDFLPFFALHMLPRDRLHPAVRPPPPNVVLWETHMAQLGRSQSTGCTKAVSPRRFRPDQRITGVEAQAPSPGTHSHSFGIHMPDGSRAHIFQTEGTCQPRSRMASRGSFDCCSF